MSPYGADFSALLARCPYIDINLLADHYRKILLKFIGDLRRLTDYPLIALFTISLTQQLHIASYKKKCTSVNMSSSIPFVRYLLDFVRNRSRTAGLAQSVERQALNLMVEGSSPSFGVLFFLAAYTLFNLCIRRRLFRNPDDKSSPTQMGRKMILVQLLNISTPLNVKEINSIHQLKLDSLPSRSTELKEQEIMSNDDQFE